MGNTDKRNKFEEEVFTYRTAEGNKVFIYWHSRQVTILKGKQAQKFLSQIESLDARAAQLVMAKVTGNFKRGNER